MPRTVSSPLAAILLAACTGPASPRLTCGPGTHELDRRCLPDAGLTCGPGTHADGGLCLVDAGPVTCGPGTHLDNGACAPDTVVTCGAGTHPAGSQCLPDATPLACGPGTHALGGACLPDLDCGPGTHAAAGQCIPDAGLTCGPGTRAEGGQCVPSAASMACGPATHLAGDVCLPDAILTCGAGTHAEGTLCLPDVTPMACGPGTTAVAGACLPDLTCGPGTHASAGLCLPDATPTCGPGTHAEGSACVLDTAPVTCGTGTHAVGGVCVPDSTLSCGPGTHVEGTRCVLDATPLTCGPGTRAEGTVCLPDGVFFDVRAIATEVPADGHTVIEVRALGRRDDGSAATDEVLVVADRASAGIFPGAFALGPLGTSVYFTPCSAAAPDCLGPVRFLLVRASDPSVVLAATPAIRLVAPAGVGTPAACLQGGNVLFLDGHDGWVMWWVDTIRQASFEQWYVDPARTPFDWIFLWIRPIDPWQGEYWKLQFIAPSGQALQPGLYENPTGAPGLGEVSLGGNAAGCSIASSRFQIQDLAVADGAVQRLTATFEQWCLNGGPIYGCIHYEHP